jgi:Ca-activated chloride channel family protein
MIGTTSEGKLFDALVNIVEVNSKNSVASARTYTSVSINPRKFILSPGTYEVSLTALGNYKDKKETFTIIVKEGETIEKVINF